MKELVSLESQSFEHRQKLEYHSKCKQILDEWVRYEFALREREQKHVATQVLANVMTAINDPRFQEKYLDQCLADVEHAISNK